MWPPKISLEELKGMVDKSISHLDFRDFWMITWIDKIGIDVDGTPYFRASVHRLKSSDLSKFRVESLDLRNPRWVTLPLRVLRIFPVGTLLKGGIVFFKSHHSFLSDFKIDLNTESGHENTSIGKWKHGEELIRFMSWSKLDSGFPRVDSKRFAFNSKILVYPSLFRQSSPYDYIIFPKTELGRFYWFPSTRLFRALMDGKTSSELNNTLYVPQSAVKKSDEKGEYHEILIGDRMHLTDVKFIARLAFSSDALRSANTIYQSVINAKLENGNKGILHLDSAFPFKDHTSLKVKGYTIKLDSVTVLIVTELMECYGPWPFSRLAYDRETPRGVVDETLEKKGTKPVPSDKTDDSDDDDDKDENDEEDNFEEFILKRYPIVKPGRTFDHNQKNNNRTINIEIAVKGSQFPNIPKEKWRLNRTRIVPPKDKREGKPIPIENISTNENTKSGGDSTNLEIVNEEDKVKRKEVPLPIFIKKLAKEFKDKSAQVNFVVKVDDNLSEDSKWYQPEATPMIIPLSEKIDVLVYLIYIRLAEKQYILCEMDRDTSTKIVLKKALDNETGIVSFRADDVAFIVTAIKDNYRTMGKLDEKSGFKVMRLYHMGDTTKNLCNRIVSKIELEGYEDD